MTKFYKVNPEYWDEWGGAILGSDPNAYIVDEYDVQRLAREWDKDEEDLLEQLDELFEVESFNKKRKREGMDELDTREIPLFLEAISSRCEPGPMDCFYVGYSPEKLAAEEMRDHAGCYDDPLTAEKIISDHEWYFVGEHGIIQFVL